MKNTTNDLETVREMLFEGLRANDAYTWQQIDDRDELGVDGILNLDKLAATVIEHFARQPRVIVITGTSDENDELARMIEARHGAGVLVDEEVTAEEAFRRLTSDGGSL